MGEYLRFELRFRDVPFRNVSLRVAEVDAGRLLAGGEAIAELLFSPSDSAKSCLMISPFSHFSAFLGPPAHLFAKIANTARAVATPINTIPIIARFPTTCGQKQWFKAGILHLLELQDVGYRSCCPHPPLLCPRAALGSQVRAIFISFRLKTPCLGLLTAQRLPVFPALRRWHKPCTMLSVDTR